MEEAEILQEMYMKLYKHVHTLQYNFYDLAKEADEILLRTSHMYQLHLRHSTSSKEEAEKQFEKLFRHFF